MTGSIFVFVLCHFVNERPPLPTRRYSAEPIIRHVVRLSPSNELIGFIQLYTGGPNTYDDDYAIELGYWISEQYWNLGYCSEMVSKVVEIAEANSWSQQILALIYDGNDASEKVLLKNGFRYSQINRQTKYGDASIFVYETKHYKMLREKI